MCHFPVQVMDVIIYAISDLNVSPNSQLNSIYNDASWCDWLIDNDSELVGTFIRRIIHCYKLLNEACRLRRRILITGHFNIKDINCENCTTCHNEKNYEFDFIEC